MWIPWNVCNAVCPVQVKTRDAKLLMTEPLFNLASIQQVTQEVAFEHFGFQAMHAVTAPELVMHAHAVANPDDTVAQSLSGLVLDAGYSFTHAVPIFDGRVVKPAVRRIRVGGKLLTNLMKEWVCIPPGTASAFLMPAKSSTRATLTEFMLGCVWLQAFRSNPCSA